MRNRLRSLFDFQLWLRFHCLQSANRISRWIWYFNPLVQTNSRTTSSNSTILQSQCRIITTRMWCLSRSFVINRFHLLIKMWLFSVDGCVYKIFMLQFGETSLLEHCCYIYWLCDSKLVAHLFIVLIFCVNQTLFLTIGTFRSRYEFDKFGLLMQLRL